MGLSTSYTGYDDGRFTGDGGKYDPAGIVHKGEFVFTKEATSRIGVDNLYKMMRGYSDGGYVAGTVMDTFSYCVQIGATGTVPVKVNSAQFDDGYKQVSGVGINSVA